MAINSLQELYQNKLQLMLDAEHQILRALPQMAQQAGDDRLKQALQTHEQETQQQADQLQQLLQQQQASRTQGPQTCKSMQALIQEGQQMLGQIQDQDTKDAFIIAAAQGVEHHEIADYGTARAWARQLGKAHDVQILERILNQEKQTDDKLTRLAEQQVNQEATRGDREVPMGTQSDRNAPSQGSRASGATKGRTTNAEQLRRDAPDAEA
jgi:ferritin-like metal-binding protein YciE